MRKRTLRPRAIDAIRKAKAICDYYEMNRGVGHTRLLFDGIRGIPNKIQLQPRALFMAHTFKAARILSRGHERVFPMSPDSNLAGYRCPLAIDHRLITTLLRALVAELEEEPMSKSGVRVDP